MTSLQDEIPKKIAFFDFDGTLARRDSLWPFLLAVLGYGRCYLALIFSLLSFLVFPIANDYRTVIKARMLRFLLRGCRVEDIQPAARSMQQWPQWIAQSVERLRWHHEQGHRVVIATGSLDLYIRQMLGDLPVDDVLCTRMEVCGDVLTGRMTDGNCVRSHKAALVAAYMSEHGPFDESWAYGNVPHDLPMMALTTHRVIVQ